MDGAGVLRRMRDIQLPLIAPTLFFLMVINITDSFVDSFGIVDITTSGGPARATDLMVYKIYTDGFQGKDYSLAAAQSIVLMLLVIAPHLHPVPLRRAAHPLSAEQAMIERTPLLDSFTHALLIFSLVALLIPLWIIFVAASHDFHTVNQVPMPLLAGQPFLREHGGSLDEGQFRPRHGELADRRRRRHRRQDRAIGDVGVLDRLFQLPAADADVLADLHHADAAARSAHRADLCGRGRRAAAVPVDLRRRPGFSIDLPEWNLLNSYSGLILPLVATATGTFLYRQFFLTVPDELTEAAKMDGAGPIRFFFEMLLPLSRTNMAALATIMFVWSWNQYLWPLLIITDHVTFRDRDDAAAEDRAGPAVRRAADLEHRHGRQPDRAHAACAGHHPAAALVRARPHLDAKNRSVTRWPKSR